MNYATLLRGVRVWLLLWLGPLLGGVPALASVSGTFRCINNSDSAVAFRYTENYLGTWYCPGSGFTVPAHTTEDHTIVVDVSPANYQLTAGGSFTCPPPNNESSVNQATASGGFLWELTYGAGGGTNVTAITCFQWTNMSPAKVAVPAIQMRDSAGLWYDVDDSEWSGRVVWPKGVISSCITNSGASPGGQPWCGGEGGWLRIWDSRKPLGDPGSGEVLYTPSSCVTNGASAVPNGTGTLTNQPGPVWPEATNTFGTLPGDGSATNAVTKGDIISLGNIVSGAGASIEKAVGDTGTNAVVLVAGLDTLNGTSAGIRTNTAATTNALGTVNQSLQTLNTNVAALTSALTGGGTTNGVPNGYGFSTGQVNGWIGGYGTNTAFYADLAQGTMNALGGGTNDPLQGLANGFANGTGTNGVGIDAVALNTVAPIGSWGVIPICYWDGQLISIDVASALRMDFGSVFGVGDLSWFQASVRSLALWATVIGAIILLSFDLQAAMLRVLAIPQLPNYDAQIAGTTVPGVNEAVKVAKIAIIAVMLAMLPSIVVAVISTVSSYFAIGGGDIAAGVVGGGLGAVKDAPSSPVDINNVLWSFNQWLPIVEEVIIITNYIICEALLILQVGVAALAVKAI